MPDPEGPILKVRPHLASAVSGARLVVLDLDGVMLNLEPALESRSRAIADYLDTRPYRPRTLAFSVGALEPHEMLDHLASIEPDQADEAESALAQFELDACVTAKQSTHLGVLLDACHATGRLVGVASDISEATMEAALAAHSLAAQVDAVVGRRGLDLSAFHAGESLERTASVLGVAMASCLFVSGRWQRLNAARGSGVRCVGFECGRDARRHLASGRVPVVSDLGMLARALVEA